MRKMNYLFGALALGLGVLVGTLGMSLLTNSSSPASFISKLRGQDKIQTVSGAISDSAKTSPTLNTAGGISDNNATLNKGKLDPTTNLVAQQIITDYKQDIGMFFGAWKSADMATFRTKLSKAYTGDLFEKHARRAEEFLVQGIGLDVSQITFDQVDIESADDNTATLQVNYRYTAKDYNLTDSAPVGEEHEQIVHMRVNLLKQNSRWLITGESVIQ
ncbi:hypothetical protein [Desulfosporosinus sp. Sb-LF]|uniref:hypothetical protein n=1 Tax=Desulfosporosinus sp. Sb-LF TaxID=2560027 RepID=UPI00107F3666|nr:hypothetical protein [Desulfosporosinus sp. Sb-LF]TGE33838.1 hypothetical protein E4K68_03190 [Desulfosporosinus sp. Sb-LF]